MSPAAPFVADGFMQAQMDKARGAEVGINLGLRHAAALFRFTPRVRTSAFHHPESVKCQEETKGATPTR